jgi:nucleoside-triphosphatase THEP1
MLGYVVAEGRGAGDARLRDAVEQLHAQGVPMAGAVQVNVERDPARKCDMDLHVLGGAEIVRISQNLGAHSRGCRLDPDGLERAVGLVAAALERRPAVLVINKFGKQELQGRGFRPLIGEAIAMGVPVLTCVHETNLPGFLGFAGDMAEQLPDDAGAIAAWCTAQAIAAE